MSEFSYRTRVLACEACGNSVPVQPTGGTSYCPRCGAAQAAPARPDTVVAKSPPSDEGQRRMRLRQQDGRPLLPPAGLEQIVVGSTVPPHKMQEARMLWAATRRHLQAQPADIAAAERLLWLTMVLLNTLTDANDLASMRGLVEGALEVFMLPRHRQMMRGYLGRLAAKIGDLESAEAWIAGCDPNSEDLETDSVYRVTRAYIDTARNNPQAVLQVLGGADEVAIMDAMDPIAAVLRANAWERIGRVDVARQVLSRFMTSQGGAMSVENVVKALPPHWSVCAQSLQAARVDVRQHVGNRAAAGGGGAIGCIMLFAGCIPLFILVGLLATGHFEFPMLFMLIFPVVFGGIGLRMLLGARRAKEIAQHGIHGRGRIMQVARTGTEINDVPVMQIHVQVQVQGHPPTQASARRLLPPEQAAMLIGREVGIIWHPKYPADVVLEL